MSARTLEGIVAQMDALGTWPKLSRCHWVLRPYGVAVPYFCTVRQEKSGPVRLRLMFFEGWQTFHDYVRLRMDPDYGYRSMPVDFSYFCLFLMADGGINALRYDPGFAPQDMDAAQRTFCTRLLWEAYGVMLRLEEDEQLPVRYAGDRAMFARIETAPDVWEDGPQEIPAPPPYEERVAIPKDVLEKAKDLPVEDRTAFELDFRILPGLVTREARPRTAYALVVLDAQSGRRLVRDVRSVEPDGSLRELWESLPARLLRRLVALGRMPGELRVCSARVFRLLRHLTPELPVRLSMHDSLPRVEKNMV